MSFSTSNDYTIHYGPLCENHSKILSMAIQLSDAVQGIFLLRFGYIDGYTPLPACPLDDANSFLFNTYSVLPEKRDTHSNP